MIVDGITYSNDTPQEVIEILETARKSRRNHAANPQRLHLRYGDRATGKDWGDEWHTEGYVGNSTGSIKIPLLIYNHRSLGGGGILDNCIVAIRTTTKPYRLLYAHHSYRFGDVTLGPSGYAECPFGAFVDGENRANFETEAKRAAWVEKMTACQQLYLEWIVRSLGEKAA